MKRRTFKHELELILLVRDNRPGQGVSHTRELAKLNLRFVAVLSWAISLAAVLATVADYGLSLANWAHWQRIGWGYWVDGWRRCLSGPGWMADLRVMGRAMKGPWEWQVIYGQ